jgi:quinol monooxygenase YgiN
MSEIVFALYRPKPGRAEDLLAIVRGHVAALRELGLVTARAPIAARSRKDGTIIEVFEWASAEAIARAHRDPAVQAIWARFGECADYPSFGQLAEASDVFAGFEPLEIARAKGRKPAATRRKRAVAKARAKPARKRAPGRKRGRKR